MLFFPFWPLRPVRGACPARLVVCDGPSVTVGMGRAHSKGTTTQHRLSRKIFRTMRRYPWGDPGTACPPGPRLSPPSMSSSPKSRRWSGGGLHPGPCDPAPDRCCHPSTTTRHFSFNHTPLIFNHNPRHSRSHPNLSPLSSRLSNHRKPAIQCAFSLFHAPSLSPYHPSNLQS